MCRTVLFVPNNASHVSAQLPLAKELQRRGHRAVFLTRDSFVNKEYRIELLLNSADVSTVRYSSFYKSDFYRLFPKIGSFRKFRRELTNWVADVGADAVVVNNDDTALFDRMIVDLFCRKGKHAFLIQESIRPSIRRISFTLKLSEQYPKEIIRDIFQNVAYRLRLGPFFRKGYAHSSCTRIFVAGELFRQRLLEEGVESSRIIVTGQPRLDGNSVKCRTGKSENKTGAEKILLFCNQPVKCSRESQGRLFLDLVDAVDALDNVRLLVKLHPRDYPESFWINLLRPGQGKSLLEVTKTRTLASCFEMADAFMTIASTTCLEAMEYGLPVGLINYLPIEWHLPYRHLEEVIVVQSRNQLKNSLKSLLFNGEMRDCLVRGAEQVLLKELYLRDGKSAWRIANHIESCFSSNAK